MKSPSMKKNIFNQSLNFFWTILSFIPVILFWAKEGLNWYFYVSLAVSFVFGFLPEKIINSFRPSSSRKFYERMGVKAVRKFVQNGDVANAVGKTSLINNISQARQYLKTIAMYERFHWICLCFFLLTAILCFVRGEAGFGFLVLGANLLYNLTSISLQQYNKIRIKKIVSLEESKIP
ncbi:MAG: hypothetical protein C5B59_11535 [Bacteroidetes bacterium]|nr:MAG: hypothetical protein C5B59_11535 [Bacteroidota bacterium]